MNARASTLVATWTAIRRRLEVAGVDTPVLDARLLIEAGAGVNRLDIVTDPYRVLTLAQLEAVEALAERREAREPVSYIVGHKDFWKHRFLVTPAVLTPRPETEFAVEMALALLPPDKPARIADLGVGSGAILLSILAERPLAQGIGVDASAEALAVAAANAARLGLEGRARLHQADWRAPAWREALEPPFDLIVSNPPYIPSSAIEGLAPEVLFEPALALDGGGDGLDAYRVIIGELDALLKPQGAALFEVGAGQAEAVAAMLEQTGLVQAIEITPDLAGVGRIVSARRSGG